MNDRWARIIGIPLLGLLSPTLFLAAGVPPKPTFLTGVIVTTIITFLIWEISRKVIFYLREKFPWHNYHMKHLLLEVPILFINAILIIIGVLWLQEQFLGFNPINHSRGMVFGVYNGIILTFLIFSIYEGSYFFSKWKKSVIEAERYKKEHIQAQYEALKNQVSPHFLFNSLSVLTSLVEKDSKMAVHFIDRLAKVYRYVLDSRNMELILLKTEIEFISSYLFLLETRLGKNFRIEIRVPERLQNKRYIPPLTLQMLVENVVKHNEISENKPLKLEIYSTEDEILIVSNSYSPLREKSNHSTGTGLENINNQYLHTCNKSIKINESHEEFKVELPLITVNIS
jgi:two-component system, LytTR family, sensor kinase